MSHNVLKVQFFWTWRHAR